MLNIQSMDLSIIIVNWNSKDYLRRCLLSIWRETKGVDLEIIVVDAASFDGCENMLQVDFPQVRFIQSDKNVGFAKANNLGFMASTGECLLFLNPDTELAGAAIKTVYDDLQGLPKAGAVGCKLLNSDGTIQSSCIKAFPTLLNQLLDSEVLRRRLPLSRLWGMAPLFQPSSVPAEVDVVSGAFIMIRRGVFEKVGMFSTDYFMYSEDVDLCFKTNKSGWKNYYVPSATVTHHGGGSTVRSQVSTFAAVMMMESRWRYFCLSRGAMYGRLYRAEVGLMSLARIALVLLPYVLDLLLHKDSGWKSVIVKWRARLRWTIGLEKWVGCY